MTQYKFKRMPVPSHIPDWEERQDIDDVIKYLEELREFGVTHIELGCDMPGTIVTYSFRRFIDYNGTTHLCIKNLEHTTKKESDG